MAKKEALKMKINVKYYKNLIAFADHRIINKLQNLFPITQKYYI